MPDLPVEIWNHILDYLAYGDIDNLLSVNRVCFHRAMTIRWQSVTLPITGFREAVLARIQDPFINKHVRSLHILIHFDNPEPPPLGDPSMRNAMSQFTSALSRKFIKNLTRPMSHKIISPVDVLNIVAGIAFPCTEEICTEEIRVTTTAMWPQSAHPSLRTILPSLSRNVNSCALKSLSLHASLPELQIFLQLKPTFPLLLRFELEIKQPESTSESRDETVLSQYLVPFIQAAHLHLQRLSLKCYYSLDLTSFFANLSTFPSLRILDISRAFNKTDIYPDSFIQTCLQKFPALAGLFLPVIPRQRFHTDLDRHDALYKWLRQCIANESSLEGLKYLDIYPTAVSPAFDLVLTAIRSNAQTLERMQIRGRFFESAETAQLLHALSQCPNLKGLRMNVKLLDITVFTQLTSTLVALETLILGIDTVSPALHVDMKSYKCQCSKLKHLTTKPLPDMLSVFSQNEIRECLPSIRTIGKIQNLVMDDV